MLSLSLYLNQHNNSPTVKMLIEQNFCNNSPYFIYWRSDEDLREAEAMKQRKDRYNTYKHLIRKVSNGEKSLLQDGDFVVNRFSEGLICVAVRIRDKQDFPISSNQEFILRNDVVEFLKEKRARRILTAFFDKHRDKLEKLLWHPPNGLMVQKTLKKSKVS